MIVALSPQSQAVFGAAVAAYALVLWTFQVLWSRSLPLRCSKRAAILSVSFALVAVLYFAGQARSDEKNPYLLRAVLVAAICIPWLLRETVRDAAAIVKQRRERRPASRHAV